MEEINESANKGIPKIFQLSGKIMEQSRWLGYVAAVMIIGLYIMTLIVGYQYLQFNDLLKGLVSLGIFLFVAIGYANFSKYYGGALQKGRRSSVIGLIVILLFISCLSGVLTFLETGRQPQPIIDWTVFAIFLLRAACTIGLVIALFIYWKRLEGGLEIY